jgi:hypothetical protein
VLFAVLLATLQAAPTLVTARSDLTDEESDLRVHVAALGGVSLIQIGPPLASRGLVTGARVGLHATRPPFVLGAARFGLLPALSLRHDFGSARTEWSGVVSLSMTLWRLIILMGVGYGLSVRGEDAPAHVLEIDFSTSVRAGPVFLGLGFDTFFRPGTPSRTMQLVATVGVELELQREAFPR